MKHAEHSNVFRQTKPQLQLLTSAMSKVVKPVLTSFLDRFCEISSFWLDRTLNSIVYTNDDGIVPTATAKAWPKAQKL